MNGKAPNGVKPTKDPKLVALRAEMNCVDTRKRLDAIIVPSDDPHQGEYVADCFARRQFISGFTGSAGTAVVLHDAALLWTDGRYFLQAKQELGPEWTLMKDHMPETPEISAYLCDALKAGARVGIDPHCHSASSASTLEAALKEKGIHLQLLEENLVDGVWGAARPVLPSAPLRVHPERWAGASVAAKLEVLRGEMAALGVQALALSMLDEIAWMFNIRGNDVDHCPVALSYALVEDASATLFVQPEKVTEEVRAHLESAGVALRDYAFSELQEGLNTAALAGKRIWVDPRHVSLALSHAATKAADAAAAVQVREARAKVRRKGGKGDNAARAARAQAAKLEPLQSASPVAEMKAVKNAAELEGMRTAHLRDAAALCHFLCWLEATVRQGGQPKTEVELAEVLEGMRSKQEGFQGLSFPTIAGCGANGAIIHYCAEPATAASVDGDSILLLDSGAQFECGTTDVTRTVHLGAPTQHQRECFTRVLQGHILLDTSRFPANTPGCIIDAFARRPLWDAGLDYRHGTGHGVGAALNVHEGPQGINCRLTNSAPIKAGMVMSIEPGYYEEGQFGIRVENLVAVREAGTQHSFDGTKFLEFEWLTLVPIQAALVDPALLSAAEERWLDEYHAKVWELVSGRVEGEVLEWLRVNTQPIRTQLAAT